VTVLVDPPRWPAHGRLWSHLAPKRRWQLGLLLDAGDRATARRLFSEITRLQALPRGGLDHPQIKALRERLEADH
jgi:hypothetical protein